MAESLDSMLATLDGEPFHLSVKVPGYPLGGPNHDDDLFSTPVLHSLWRRAVQELDEHGYASAHRRLEDLKGDAADLREKFEAHENRHRYFDVCKRVCNRRMEVHGPHVKVIDSVEETDGEEGPDGPYVSWEVERASDRPGDRVPRLETVRFRLTEEGLKHFQLEQANRLLNFGSLSWERAHQQASSLVRLAWRNVESVGRALQFATLHVDIMETVLRRDRLAGYVGGVDIQERPTEISDVEESKAVNAKEVDLWMIALTLQEYLDSLGGCPTTDDEVRGIFPSVGQWHTWVGEHSDRYGSGDARSTGHRVLDDGGIRVRRREGQRHGLLDEVRALYQMGEDLRSQF